MEKNREKKVREAITNRAIEICNQMCVNFSYLVNRTRKSPAPEIRGDVFRQLYDEGYTQSAIGRTFGFDHSTINFYINRQKPF